MPAPETKTFSAKLVTTQGDTFKGIASALRPDRHGELVLPKAFLKRSKDFQGPMDAGHEAMFGNNLLSVVARVDKVEFKANSMPFEATWWSPNSENGIVNDFAAVVRDGYERKFLTDFSITFMGYQWRKPTKKELVSMEEAFPEEPFNSVLEDGELLTISPVIVGANRGTGFSMNGFNPWLEELKTIRQELSDLKALFPKQNDTKDSDDEPEPEPAPVVHVVSVNPELMASLRGFANYAKEAIHGR